MEQKREPGNKPPHTYHQFMTKEPRIYNGERKVFSIYGAGKIGQPHAKE